MLAFQLQQYPFRFGLAEGTDPRQVPPGTLTTAENVCWTQSGRAEKRNGVDALTSMGSTCSRLFTQGANLCATDGSSLYSYSAQLDSWTARDQIPNLGLTWNTLLDTNTGIQNLDQAYYSNNPLIVTAWTTGDGHGSGADAPVYVQLTDPSGALIAAPVKAHSSSGSGVRVVIVDDTAHIITRIGADIAIAPLDLSTFTVGSPTNVRTDANNATFTSYHAVAVGSTLILAYETGANALKLYSYTFSLGVYTQTATGGITGETGNTFSCMAIDATAGESLYIVYSRSSPDLKVRIAVANPSTLAQTVAPVDLEASAVGTAGTYTFYSNVSVRRLTASSCVAMWSTGASSTQTARASSIVCSSSGTLTTASARGTWGAQWLSHPFFVGTRMYATALDITTATSALYTSPSTYLAEIETSTIGSLSAYVPHRYVGTVDVLIGGASATGFMPQALTLSSTKVVVASPYQATAAAESTSWRCGARQVAVTTGTDLPTDLWRTVTVGKEAYIAGAAFSAYDGHICFDYGAHRSAPLSGLAVGGGGSMAAGNYLYASVPEYRSMAGVLHRGPTFTLTTAVTTGATDSVTVSVVSISVQTKADVSNGGLVTTANVFPESIALYRTTVGGSVLQRLTMEPNSNVIVDNPSNWGQTFTDTKADAGIDGLGTTLASRPALYTTGGILDDYAPPASVTQFHHADRLFVLAGDQQTWWYSKAFQDDLGTAPGFHPDFLIAFDETQVAGASLDDKAIFYSATGIRYMYGLGPSPAGLNNDFVAPTPIQTDVGCTNARSLVSTPDGHMFLSARGIYLLTRKLEVTWIGRPVRATLALFPNVTSAILVAKHNQVRFTCNNTAGTAGVVLVYDYVENQWSTFRHTATGYSYGCPYADACIFGGEWTFATPSGLVYQESSATYLDSGTWVPMTLETAWISSAGPLAFQSVRSFALDGTSNTDHDLTIQVGFDSETAYAQTATFLAQSAVTTVGPEECEITIGTRRKCSQIRFKITDATPTTGTIGTGQGPAFEMMGIEVGAKQGFGNNPATKRA